MRGAHGASQSECLDKQSSLDKEGKHLFIVFNSKLLCTKNFNKILSIIYRMNYAKGLIICDRKKEDHR